MPTTQCTCGTLLPPPDAAGLVTCPSCGRGTRPAGPEAEAAPTADAAATTTDGPGPDAGSGSAAWPAPPVAAPMPGNQWATPAPIAGAPAGPPPSTDLHAAGTVRTRKVGCAVIPGVIAVVVALIVVSALRSCDPTDVVSKINPNVSPFDSTITLSGTANVVSSSPEELQVAATTQTSEGGTTERRLSLLRFDGSGAKVLWQSDPFGEDTSRVEVAQVGDTVFAGTGDRLYALDGDTGKTRWSTALHDKVTNGCEDCFESVGGVLVVRTVDGYVAAYKPGGSEPVWTKRLRDPSGSISIAGGHLLIVDAPEDDKAVTPVQLVDPATGKVVRSDAPTCPRSPDSSWDVELNPGDRIRTVPGTRDVMAVFGFGDACVVRWDPSTGTVKWTSRLDGASSVNDEQVVVGTDDLVVPASSQAMATIDLHTGKAHLIDQVPEATVVPNTIVGRTLLADTATTRGTAQHGLAAFDLRTGKKLWAKTNLGAAAPVSRSPYFTSDALFDGAPRSLLVSDADGVHVVVFDGANHTFAVRSLDPATGNLGEEVRRAFTNRYGGTPSLTVESVADGRMLITIDSLLQSLPVTGRGEVTTFPEQD
ncbi:MAG: PQQ-binding-like beta-propeller repeat protein [Acidimicrobiales bacterium]